MSLVLALTVTASIGLLVGGAALVFGLRGRRLDDHPCCRRCGFDLLGLDLTSTDARCPECGSRIDAANHSHAVRLGRRKRQPWLAWSGGITLTTVSLPAGAIALLVWTGGDLDHYKPVWLLVHEGGSTRVQTSENARAELRRRLVLDLVSGSQARAIAGEALARQTGPDEGWDSQWGTLFEIAWLGGWLPESMTDQYLRNAVRIDVPSPGPPGPDGSILLELLVRDRTGSVLAIRTRLRLTLPADGPLRATAPGEFNAAGLLGGGYTSLVPPASVNRAQFFETLGITPTGGPDQQAAFQGVLPPGWQAGTEAPTPAPKLLRVAPWPSDPLGTRLPDAARHRQRLVVGPGGLPPHASLGLEVWTAPSQERVSSVNSELSTWWSNRPVPVVPSADWPAERQKLELRIGN